MGDCQFHLKIPYRILVFLAAFAKKQSIPISPEKMSNLSMTLLPDGGAEMIASNLEDRAARTIFTERSDKASNNNHDNDELHNELLPALRASQSTPTINTPRSRN